jgi:hypothetical protein
MNYSFLENHVANFVDTQLSQSELQKMPLPLQLPAIQIEAAVTSALEKSGAIPPQAEATEALKDAGADVRRLATELANLVFTAKDPIKLKAIERAFQLHGINLVPDSGGSGSVSIQFNVVGNGSNYLWTKR